MTDIPVASRTWNPWQDPFIAVYPFWNGPQPIGGGDISGTVNASDSLSRPIDFDAVIGSLKGSGERHAMGIRFDGNQAVGGHNGQGTLPPPYACIDFATLRMTAQPSGGDSVMDQPFNASCGTIIRDGLWDPVVINTKPTFEFGMQPTEFEIRDAASVVQVGPGPLTGAPGASVRMALRVLIITGCHRGGSSFAVGPSGMNLKEIDFRLNKEGAFGGADTAKVTLYPCNKNDGTDDAPKEGSAAIHTTGTLLVSTFSSVGSGFDLETFVFPSEVSLTEGRYCAALEFEFAADGRSVGLQSRQSATYDGRTVQAGVTDPIAGFGIGMGHTTWSSTYSYPHQVAQNGLPFSFTDTLRELGPLTAPNNWDPTQALFNVAIPAFPGAGQTFDVDIKQTMQAHIERDEYVAEWEDTGTNHGLGIYLGTPFATGEDNERTISNVQLIMGWSARPHRIHTPGGNAPLNLVESGGASPLQAVEAGGPAALQAVEAGGPATLQAVEAGGPAVRPLVEDGGTVVGGTDEC